VKFSELEGARIGLWGLGAEAAAFATLCPGDAIECVSDDAPTAPELTGPLAGVRWIAPEERPRAFAELDLVVRAPGVSIHRPEIENLKAAGVEVATATGLWLADGPPAPVIAVTGTKGKSTSAAMIAALLAGAGKSVELAGNIGRPAIELLDAPVPDFYVIELSSYQTADLTAGAPIVLITSLHPEHIDWHGGAEQYYADKLRIATLPELRRLIVNGEDAELLARITEKDFETYGGDARITVVDGVLTIDGEVVIAAEDFPLPGRHNLLNACGALAAVDAAGVELAPADAGEILSGFTGLPHRLQRLVTEDGVVWIDDSISTTPETAIAALEAVGGEAPVLICGGFDREQDYAALGSELTLCGAQLVTMPTTGPRIAEAALAAGLDAARIRQVGSLAEAVAAARELASSGGTVLLSPAAPSYDAFNDFAERGEQFARLAGGTT
jgi:UDP-N-acetylmuramoylalanine--D-glutamate ligase